MFSLQPKANVKCSAFCGMQKSGRLHRKQPGFCVDRVRGIIGFSAKVCAWGKLYWSEPLLRGIDREVQRGRGRDEPKTKGKHTEAKFGDTQWKPHLLCVNWHVEVVTVENTCSRMCCLASNVVMLNLCVHLKCQWYFRSITLNQAPSVSSVNPSLRDQWIIENPVVTWICVIVVCCFDFWHWRLPRDHYSSLVSDLLLWSVTLSSSLPAYSSDWNEKLNRDALRVIWGHSWGSGSTTLDLSFSTPLKNAHLFHLQLICPVYFSDMCNNILYVTCLSPWEQ